MFSNSRVCTRQQFLELEKSDYSTGHNQVSAGTTSLHDASGDNQSYLNSPSTIKSLPATPPLSTKRQSVLRKRCTPRPPALPRLIKTAPVFNYSENRWKKLCGDQATIVTFKNKLKGSVINPLYSPNNCAVENYLHQCFQVYGTLGCGSFGRVVKAKSRYNGKFYAIKYTIEPYQSISNRRSKLEEVKKHELLPEHPNLIKFYCAWEEGGRLYIQTELCEKSLSDVCESEHEIPENRVWSYFIDVLLAVDHLHSNNLIHVDIKPENIFVTKSGICKLGDFGLVFDELNDDIDLATEGDSKYLAEEVLNSRPTKAADIFSLGITLLELATDMELPKHGRYWSRMRHGLVNKDFIVDLIRIIFSMINHNPSLRPTTSDLLKDNAVLSKMNCRQRRVHLQYKHGKKQFNMISSVIDHFNWITEIFVLLIQNFLMPLFFVRDHLNSEICNTPTYSKQKNNYILSQYVNNTPANLFSSLNINDKPSSTTNNLKTIPFKVD